MSSSATTLNGRFLTSWVDESRCNALVAAVESTLPTPRLMYRIDSKGAIQEVSTPSVWLARRVASDDEIALVCNGSEDQLVSLAISRVLLSESKPWYRVNLSAYHFDEDFCREGVAVVSALATAASAVSGGLSIVATAARTLEDYLGSTDSPIVPPRVAAIHWINYWSAATCRLLEFTRDDSRHGLFHRAERIEDHGVVLQLTDEPLDLDIPAHRAALDAAYDAFPQVPQGGRARREAQS